MSKKSLLVYGIGNALVDKQTKITDVELEELRLQKGGMVLTDDAGQTNIQHFLGSRDSELHAGGSAANTIVGMAQFGGRVAYAGSVGNDEFGKIYLADFKRRGILLTTKPKPNLTTGTCLILITPDGERTMNTHLGASTQLGLDDIDRATVAAAEWIYVEGYLLSGETTKAAAFAAMDMAKAAGTKIAFSFSDGFVVEAFGADVRRIVGDYADLVFANEREAAAYTATRDPEVSLDMILEECKNACVTMGGAGSLVHYAGKTYKVAALPAKPVDLTGAGDMYAAGFLYGICSGATPDKAGLLGSQAAHRVVIQMGARLPGDLRGLAAEVLQG